MYKNILNFVESKIEGFEKPEIIFGEEFTYGVSTRDITVPEDYIGSLEQQSWWKRFMMKYLMMEYGLFLTEKDNYIFSLLHEIGHYITLEGIPADVINHNYSQAMNKIDFGLNAYDYEKAYREINIERMADLWAIDFIETYPEVLEIGKESLC
jgi:hypothetical protein